MRTIGIKELQTNPAVLTRSLESNRYAIITKRNQPIGIAVPFDDKIIEAGLKTALIIDAHQKGYLSLGQLADALKINKKEALKMLALMGEESINYDFADDIRNIEHFL